MLMSPPSMAANGLVLGHSSRQDAEVLKHKGGVRAAREQECEVCVDVIEEEGRTKSRSGSASHIHSTKFAVSSYGVTSLLLESSVGSAGSHS